MKWFIDLSTRGKLSLGFGLMVFFLLIVIVTAYTGITAIRDSQKELFQRDFNIALNLRELRSDQNRTRADILEMIMTDDRAKQQAMENDIRERASGMDKIIMDLFEFNKNEPKFTGKLRELDFARAAYIKTRDEQFALIYKGKSDQARQLGVSVQEERYNRIRSIAKELGDNQIEVSQLRIAQSEEKTKETVFIFLIVGAVALVMSIGMSIFLNTIIAKPLKEISGIAERVASGDLSVVVPSDERKDEVGSLKNAFAVMTRYLQEMANVSQQIAKGDLTVTVNRASDKDMLGNAFADMIGNLRKINHEIREGVTVLASASSEILASTTQVASGAAETASAVSETTTTVEEVKQTAQVSSQKAKYVSETAQKTAQVSQSGKKSVEETIEGMNRVREQMESVAESIVRLSEQSQAIGEIIATVNDLAEQSNLLAVNAAIEAAKAGEQGKGFAVVAQEIKSMAEQSKQATAQVRAILTDIQKATSVAVMATEQGSKAVEAGVKQSAEAGESIRALAESIAEAAQAATQIAASSQQQFVGMEQVTSAIENIKKATEQNVSGTKQTEASAQSLHEVGQKLKQIVEQYKV